MFAPQDLHLLPVFAAVARRGSFTAAASELGLSKSVVSAHVRTLEARVGARLLERTTRRLRLTEAGARILASAVEIEASLSALSRDLEAARDEPTGRLRVATTHDLAALLVAPAAAALLARFPALLVDVVADDGVHDLIASGADLAVRLGTPRDSSYVMRKLAVFEEIIVGAPSLAGPLAQARRPRELAEAPWVRHALVSGELMTFQGPDGQQEQLAPRLRGSANTGYGVRALLLGGAGLGVAPTYQVQADLDGGALLRLCPDWIWRPVTLYAIQAESRLPRRAVAVFLDELAARAGVGMMA